MKKYFKHIIMFIFLIVHVFFTVNIYAQEMSDREKQSQINYLFKMGTECYYQGKYSRAVKYWEAVLDIDPQQTQPPALIENAREQIQKESLPVYDKMKKEIETGDYFAAQEDNLKLLDLDSTNKEYTTIKKKLKKIVAIFPTLPKGKDVPRLILQSVYAYSVEPIDIDFSFSSIMLAKHKNPDSKRINRFLELLKKEYPRQSKKHTEIKGINILDQLLQNSLNYIYQGQYVEAITECNRALKLDPKNHLAFKRLGSAYFALGNKKQAYSIWEKALKLDPGDKEIKKFLKARRQR